MTNTYQYEGFGALSEWNGQMSSAGAVSQYAAIAATGANVISISPRLWTADGDANTVGADQDKTESDASLIAGISAAKAAGIDVILRPHVTGLDGTASYDLNPSDTPAFFQSYKEQIVHYATIAQQTGVSVFSIGNELGSLVGEQYKSEWLDIIAAVRTVYQGELTYSAAMNEAKDVSFWGELDTIGVNAYASLSNTTDPTVAELKAAWNEVPVNDYWASVLDNKSPVDFIKSLSDTYGKQVLLTEVGYRSIDGGATDPGQWYRDGVSDVSDQTNAYQAFLETWTAEGGSWLQGYNFWSWELDGRTDTTGYSIIGKPAEQLVKQYFSGAGATTGLNVQGSATDDLIDLGRGADHIYAGLGNDVIRAGAGDDVIVAGPQTIERLATTTVTFKAFGTAVAGQQAVIQLRVNGQLVGTAITLQAASDITDYQTYTVTFTNPDDIKSLEFDLINATPGRAAFFKGIYVNGYELSTSDVTNASAPGTFQLYVNTIRLDATGHSELFYGAGSDNDLIEGGKGDDTIDGGAGVDTAVYSGSYADYTLKLSGKTLTVADHVAGRDGTDALKNVEFLQFSDRTVAVSSLDLVGSTPAPLLTSASLGKVNANAVPDLVVKGGSVANATVTLYDQGVAVGSAVASSTGEYTINVTDLADGAHTLTLVASSDGVASAATAVGLVVIGKASAIVGLLTGASTVPSAVWITDGQPVTLSIAQLGDTREALSHAVTPYTLTVQDTAANVLANLDRLTAADNLGSITLKGGSVFAMASAPAIQRLLAANQAIFDKIDGDFAFEVTGSGSNGSVSVGHYGETGALEWQKTTAITGSGSRVYISYADGHTVQTEYGAHGERTSEMVTTAEGRVSTQWGVVGKPFASSVTISDASGKITSIESFRADGSSYSSISYADGGSEARYFDASGSLLTKTISTLPSGVVTTSVYIAGVKTQSTTAELSGAKHVTDYGVAGQLYTTKTVDFDASGKIVGISTWRADSTAYSQITYARDGSSSADYFDAAGRMAKEIDTSAKGVVTTSLYANGAMSQKVVVETTGAKHITDYGIAAQAFTTKTVDYDATGRLTQLSTHRADGSLYSKIVYGTDGSTNSDYFDGAGKLAKEIDTSSKGAVTTTLYAEGVKSQATVLDVGGAKHITTYGITGQPYATITLDYDASGKLVSLGTLRGDGTVYSKTTYGSDGSSNADYLDAGGKLSKEIDIAANGGVTTTLYTAGVKTQKTVADVDGSRHITTYGVAGQPYATTTSDYDASGRLVSFSTFRADGSAYSKITNAADGSSSADYFDAAGKLTKEYDTFANGGSSTILYKAGVKTDATIVETTGAKHVSVYGVTGQPYTTSTTDYDAAGKVTMFSTWRSNGSFYSKIVYGADGSTTSEYYGTSGKLQEQIVKSGATISDLLYNADGAKTTLTVTDAAGKHVTTYGITGKAYDTQVANSTSAGVLTSVIQYNLDGTTTMSLQSALATHVGRFDVINSYVTYVAGQLSAPVVNLIGSAAINATGDAGANEIHGNAAANTLSGLGGNDILDGGAGADTMIGGLGDDIYYVDNIGDKVIEVAGQGVDTVYSAVTFSLAGQAIENLIYTGGGNGNLTGNELNNTLTGNGAMNVIDGGAGADTMIGGGGNDTYYVDNLGDRVIEDVGGGTDLVYSSVSFSLAGQEIERLTLTGSTAINASGNELANIIVGNAGANVISGGLGSDTLTGGAGADVFVFNTALGANNIDRITDFTVGSDKIQLDSAVFTSLSKGVLNADAFFIGTAAQDATDRVIYNKQTGALFYDDDGVGAHAAQQFAVIAAGLTTLSHNDFVVV